MLLQVLRPCLCAYLCTYENRHHVRCTYALLHCSCLDREAFRFVGFSGRPAPGRSRAGQGLHARVEPQSTSEPRSWLQSKGSPVSGLQHELSVVLAVLGRSYAVLGDLGGDDGGLDMIVVDHSPWTVQAPKCHDKKAAWQEIGWIARFSWILVKSCSYTQGPRLKPQGSCNKDCGFHWTDSAGLLRSLTAGAQAVSTPVCPLLPRS